MSLESWVVSAEQLKGVIARMNQWDETTPIYLQLRRMVLEQILQGVFSEGEAIPSVRQVAAVEKINPITVSKAYQMLVDENLVEKIRQGHCAQPGNPAGLVLLCFCIEHSAGRCHQTAKTVRFF